MYCYNIEVFFLICVVFINVIDRVPRHCLDPRLGQGGVGRRAPVLSGAALGVNGRLPCAISIVVWCDSVIVLTAVGSWFG